jgi:hypothetical protein
VKRSGDKKLLSNNDPKAKESKAQKIESIFGEREDLIDLLARGLEKNIAGRFCGSTVKIFTTAKIPSISIKDYLTRLVDYGITKGYEDNTDAILLAAIIYLDRYLESQKDYPLAYDNVHRLFSTMFVLACKVHNDVVYGQAHFAKVAGIDLDDLNKQESIVVKNFQLDFFIKKETFDEYVKSFKNFQSEEKKATNEKSVSQPIRKPS